MTDYLSASILNTLEELQVFPVNQSIYLSFSQDIEDSQVKNYISIFRMIDESGLFNFGDTYNQSIGYVREKFDTVDYTFIKTINVDNTCSIELKPLSPLHPSSNYGILVDKAISSQYVTIVKTVSKSDSTIELLDNTGLSQTFTITMMSTPFITATANLITISISSTSSTQSYSLNLKSSKNYVIYNGIKICFKDIVYVEGEVFTINTTTPITLEESLYSIIHTSLSASVTKILSTDNSKRLDYSDVTAYYQANTPVTDPVLPPNTYSQNGVLFKYIGSNRILVTLPSGIVTTDLDLVNMTFTSGEAFENYTLDMYGLYDPSIVYVVLPTVKDSSNIILTIVQTIRHKYATSANTLISFPQADGIGTKTFNPSISPISFTNPTNVVISIPTLAITGSAYKISCPGFPVITGVTTDSDTTLGYILLTFPFGEGNTYTITATFLDTYRSTASVEVLDPAQDITNNHINTISSITC